MTPAAATRRTCGWRSADRAAPPRRGRPRANGRWFYDLPAAAKPLVGQRRRDNLMTYETYRHLQFTRRGRILTVAINRPEKLNAVHGPLHEELSRVFYDVAADPGVRHHRLDRRGPCLLGRRRLRLAPGDDRRAGRLGALPLRGQEDHLRPARSARSRSSPRCNGHAIGLGATIALFCDVIFAAKMPASAIRM